MMQCAVMGEMLMPESKAEKVGLVSKDSAAWMSVQAVRRKRGRDKGQRIDSAQRGGINELSAILE